MSPEYELLLYTRSKVVRGGITHALVEQVLGFTTTLLKWVVFLRTLDQLDPFRARGSLQALLMVNNLLELIDHISPTPKGAKANKPRNYAALDYGKSRGSGGVERMTIRVKPDTLERHMKNSKALLKTMRVKVPRDQKGGILESAVQEMVTKVNKAISPNDRQLALREK